MFSSYYRKTFIMHPVYNFANGQRKLCVITPDEERSVLLSGISVGFLSAQITKSILLRVYV